MKSKHPNHIGSPHMTQAEVNKFLENMMREKFGPQAELMIQITRLTQQFIADQEVAQIQPTRNKS
jgi:hypothetical protein